MPSHRKKRTGWYQVFLIGPEYGPKGSPNGRSQLSDRSRLASPTSIMVRCQRTKSDKCSAVTCAGLTSQFAAQPTCRACELTASCLSFFIVKGQTRGAEARSCLSAVEIARAARSEENSATNRGNLQAGRNQKRQLNTKDKGSQRSEQKVKARRYTVFLCVPSCPSCFPRESAFWGHLFHRRIAT
jgi:hypothetical protein